MNYTNPTDLNYDDKPTDWLNSSLIFAKALGKLLKPNEGILIHLGGDSIDTLPERMGKDVEKIIVYRSTDDMINIMGAEKELDKLPDGQMITLHDKCELN